MSKLNNLSNNEAFETLFSEIADDLAEAINGGNAHNCHLTHSSVSPKRLPIDVIARDIPSHSAQVVGSGTLAL